MKTTFVTVEERNKAVEEGLIGKGIDIPKEVMNLFVDGYTEDMTLMVRDAINYEYQDMRLEDETNNLERKKKQLESDGLTSEKKASLQQDIKVCEENIESAKTHLAFYQSSADALYGMQTENDPKHVRLLIRLIASRKKSSKFSSLVLRYNDFGEQNLSKLIEIMGAIHEPEEAILDDNGMFTGMNATQLHKKARVQLGVILKQLFSIYAENPIFKNVKWRFDKSKKLLNTIHETWVKDVLSKKDGTYSYRHIVDMDALKKNSDKACNGFSKIVCVACYEVIVKALAEMDAPTKGVSSEKTETKTETPKTETDATIIENNKEEVAVLTKTVTTCREYLEKMGVEFPKSAKKSELVDLVHTTYVEWFKTLPKTA